MIEIIKIEYDEQARRDEEVVVGFAEREELAAAFCQLLAFVEGGWYRYASLSAEG